MLMSEANREAASDTLADTFHASTACPIASWGSIYPFFCRADPCYKSPPRGPQGFEVSAALPKGRMHAVEN